MRFKRFLIVVTLIAVWAMTALNDSAATQVGGRRVRLTLLPDFESGIVYVDGNVSPGDISSQAASLADWGLDGALEVWQADSQGSGSWSVKGMLPGAEIISDDESGGYHLSLEPLTLGPGDSLDVMLPFANVYYARITPPPDNLDQLISDAAPLFPFIQYSADEIGQELILDIPFSPVSKQIHLTLTPLIGEVLTGHTDSFRLSGEVIFSGVENYTQFERHCQSDPSDFFFRYRTAHLLFALDYPPAYHFGFLNPAYQFKPTYSLVRSDVSSCQYEVGSGQVTAHFTGRVFNVKGNDQLYPPALGAADVVESHHRWVDRRGPTDEYEMILGEVVLAADDRLSVSVPHTLVREVSPPPSRLIYDASGQAQIEYQGPRRFTLSIRYVPQPQLLLAQFPTTLRAFSKPLETNLGPFFDPSGVRGSWTWGVLIAGLGLAAISHSVPSRVRVWWFLAGLLIGAALLYGLRGSFGWLLLAAVWYAIQAPRLRGVAKGLVAVIVVICALFVDAQAEGLFAVLSSLELEMTPLTPLIMMGLSVVLYLMIFKWNRQTQQLSLWDTLPTAFFLFTLSVYDVLQKSLPALILIACGGAYLLYRIQRMTDTEKGSAYADLLPRLKLAWRSRLIPVSVVAMTIFAAQNNLQSTTAVFGSGVGVWGPLMILVLLFLSILLALSAIALLFVMLYPLIPFRPGYVKGVVFGIFLLGLFMLGVGSDNRLVNSLDTLLVGRLVYYVSVPVLIGLYLDISEFRREEQAQRAAKEEPAEELTFDKAAGMYLKRLQGMAGTLGGILSIVAPPLYAFLVEQPLVTTYFDLLEKLISLSVVVL